MSDLPSLATAGEMPVAPAGSMASPPPPPGSTPWASPPPPSGSTPWDAPAPPQYTRKAPFVPAQYTQEGYDTKFGLPGGSIYKDHKGVLRVVPTPKVEEPGDTDPTTGDELDPSESPVAPEESSGAGAALRGVVRGLPAAATGVIGFGAAAPYGAAAGAPLGPVGMAAGGLLAGLAGAMGFGYLTGVAQEWALKKMPLWAQQFLGQSEEQRQNDKEAHDKWAMIGEMLPQILAFRPGAMQKLVPEGASFAQRMMTGPVLQRAVPAGIGAGQEVAMGAVQGEPFDWEKAAIAGGFGAALNKTTGIGNKLLGAGDRLPRATLGRHYPGSPHGAAPNAPQGTPPPGAPGVGDTFGMPMGPQAEVAPVKVSRVQGDLVFLKDAEGIEHPHTAADVARLRQEVPAAPAEAALEAPAAPTEAPPAPPAPVAAPAEPPPPARAPVTMDDLDRMAGERVVVPRGTEESGAPVTPPTPQASSPPETPAARPAPVEEAPGSSVTPAEPPVAEAVPPEASVAPEIIRQDNPAAAAELPNNAAAPEGAPATEARPEAPAPNTDATPTPARDAQAENIQERAHPQDPRTKVEIWADEIARLYAEKGGKAAREAYTFTVKNQNLNTAASAVLQDKVRERIAAAGLPSDPNYSPGPSRNRRPRQKTTPPEGLSEESAPFYSALTRAVESIPQPKAPGAQWSNLIRNLTNKGVKQDEIDWSGVTEWLKDHPGLVTKEQLVEQLRANEVRVEEMTHGGNTPFTPEQKQAIIDWAERQPWVSEEQPLDRAMLGRQIDEAAAGQQHAIGELEEYGIPYEMLQPFYNRGNGPSKYSGYTLPGGENYRELLLSLPGKDAEVNRRMQEIEAAKDAMAQDRDPTTNRMRDEAGWHALSREAEQMQARQTGSTYRTSHWEEPNVLAHIRFDDRLSYGGQPNSVRPPSENLFSRNLASLFPLGVMQSGVVGIANHHQVQRAIILSIPVKVMDILKRLKITPEELFGEKSVQPALLGASLRDRIDILSGIATALGETEARARAKILGSLSTGRNEELFPALRTSDLNPTEIGRFIDPAGNPESPNPKLGGASTRAAFPDAARAGRKLSAADSAILDNHFARAGFGTETSSGSVAGRSAELSAADRANLLERHAQIVSRGHAEPKRTLHISEIQSDWHQAGRRKGYQGAGRDTAAIDRDIQDVVAELQRRVPGIDEMSAVSWQAAWDQHPELRQRSDELYRERGERQNPVPNAPLKTQWPELAMKRVLRYAAEHGYDRVSWDVGDTHNARYDLSKHISRVELHDNASGGVGRPNMEGPFREGMLVAHDHNGRKVISQYVRSPDEIVDLIGKDVADKLLAADATEARQAGLGVRQRELSGLELQIGGEGMRGFYDKILPSFLNKYGKKWGAKVERGEVPVSEPGWDIVSGRGNFATYGSREAAEAALPVIAERYSGVDPATLRIVRNSGQSAPVHAIDITPPMRDSVMRGQALWEKEGGTPSPAYRDMREDFDRFAPVDAADTHPAARDWVVYRGTDTGHEHVAVYDHATGTITHAGTSDQPNFVAIPDGVKLDGQIVHHNHPSSNSLSASDLNMLPQGVGMVISHTHDGDTFAARLTPAMAEFIEQQGERARTVAIPAARFIAAEQVDAVLRPEVEANRIPADNANRAYYDIANRALAQAGLIDYISTRDPWKMLPKDLADRAFERATEAVRALEYLGAEHATDDRPARTVRPEEAMGAIRRAAEELAAGRSERAGGTTAGADDGGTGRGLSSDEDPFAAPTDLAGALGKEALKEAVGPEAVPRGTGWSRRFMRTLGVGPGSPGEGFHDFNEVNRRTTAPSNAARYNMGGVSTQKWAAEEARRLDTNRLRHSYTEGLETWRTASQAEEAQLNKVLELARLQGRDFPLDGRAIILENARDLSDTDPLAHQPNAQHSKPGEIVRLDEPRLIGMFGEIRRTMDKGWDDLIETTARRYGWEGEPTPKAILEAAAAADTQREKNRLERAAKMVGAIEYGRRTAYVPFMRFGDYFMHVVAKEGAPEWTGEGKRPTVWFELLDSRTPWEKVTGGRRGPSGKAAARRAELEQKFPAELYDIRDGYWHPSQNELRSIGIPAIEKLFTLIGNDSEKFWRARARSAEVREHPDGEGFAIRFADGEFARADRHGKTPGEVLKWARAEDADVRAVAADAYAMQERAVESLLDEVYREMTAGFKKRARNTPGYDPDLSRSIGSYFNWLASNVSNMKHRDAIDAANLVVDGSYDPLTRKFWQEYDQHLEREHTPLDGALSKARNAAFYWALGLNASSTFKNLLDGPLIHMPVLTTGLGAEGRATAAATYANAAQQILRSVHIGKNGLDVEPMRGAKTPGERALLEDAERTGLLRPTGMEEIAAIRRKGTEALTPQQKFNRRVLEIWGSNMAATDRLTRSAMLLSAYRTADKVGMDKINRVWDRDEIWQQTTDKTPEAWAKFMTERVAGIWGDFNRIPAMRGNLGAAVGQFQSYNLNYLSTIYQLMRTMGPEGMVSGAMMLGGVGLLGGAFALPFVGDAAKAGEAVWRAVSQTDIDLKSELARAMEAMGFSKSGAEVVLHGFSRQVLGFDLGSIGLGNFLSDFGRGSGLEVLGPVASIFGGAPFKAAQRAAHGQAPAAVAAELLPSPVRHMVRGMIAYPEEGVRTLKGGTNAQVLSPEQIGPWEKIAASAGVTSSKLIRAYEEREFQRRAGEIAKYPTIALNKRLEGMYARRLFAQQRGDAATVQALDTQIARTIANAPPGARPNVQTIKKSQRQAIDPQNAPIRQAPRQARPGMIDSPYLRP